MAEVHAASEAEGDAWEVRAAALPPGQQQWEKEQSWEKMFDLDSWRDPEWWGQIDGHPGDILGFGSVHGQGCEVI